MSYIDLTNDIWQKVNGAYGVPYDVSIPLSKLKDSNRDDDLDALWNEMWDELHHQGQVGIASYLALPQIVQIGIDKEYIDFNLLAICCVIEQQRHAKGNPDLPDEYVEYYYEGLEQLKKLALIYLSRDTDDSTHIAALSALATCSGRLKLGKVLLQLEDPELLDNILDQA